MLPTPSGLRLAFLENACEGDDELHREVLSLLQAPTANVAFLEEAAVAAVQGRLASGINLGPYLIEAPIGAGGMGEVFRATDRRLHRTVAIKVLPAEKFSDPNHQRKRPRNPQGLVGRILTSGVSCRRPESSRR